MQLSFLLIAACLVTVESALLGSPIRRPLDLSPTSLKDKTLPTVKPELYLNVNVDFLFKSFKETFGKVYKSIEEELLRKTIFGLNMELVKANNYLFSIGLSSFTMGINEISDMAPSEVVAERTGGIPPNESSSEELNSTELHQPGVNESFPSEVDWRDKGYVTPVKYQGRCGCCWAFTAIASLEGQHFNKTGDLLSLSEQQLVDCSSDFGNRGCIGGWPTKAYNYISSNGGVETNESYPYKAKVDPTCKYDPDAVEANIVSYKTVEKSELALMDAVATVGPISAPMDASLLSFQSYTSGVYDDAACSNRKPNHAVTIVGYGTSSLGKDFWIAKNSWGDKWGMNGYIYMSRNKDNQCGVASHATYPVV